MEELSAIPLQVKGTIPKWLCGFLVRNGPVYETVNGEQITHWFDGLAMLHTFHFQEGKVSYTNKYLRTDAYKSVFEEHSLHYIGFATDPCSSLFKKMITHFFPGKPVLQNANINVAKIADEYVALFETPLPVRFNPKTLETLGVLNFKDDLPKRECWMSAHPHYESAGSLNYMVEFGPESTYTLYNTPKNSPVRKIIGKIPSPRPSYMHSFSKTEQFVILSEYPFTVDPKQFISGKKPFIYNYEWDQTAGTKFLVINKFTGKLVSTFQSESFFAFHHANAFEMGDQIHLDIICYKNAEIIQELKNYFRQQEPFSNQTPYQTTLKRFILDRKMGSCISIPLMNEMCEFPKINPMKDGKEYRYLYMANPLDNHSGLGLRELYKFDHQTMETKKWVEKDCFPGEPIFVPTPQSSAEDDGVILSVINNLAEQTSFLLILDAKTFKEIGRLACPQPIPPGLHGDFLE